jgi:AsmA protein
MAKSRALKLVFKTIKISGAAIFAILVIMFLIPFIFPRSFTNDIKQWTNESINGELNFSSAKLSFFKHFPSLTLTLYDFTLKGSAPFEKDTLVAAKEVALGINLKSLFSEKVSVNEIFVTQGNINVKVDSEGRANYSVYKPDTPATNTSVTKTSGSTTSLKIAKIQVEKTNIYYNDKSLKMKIVAKDLDYLGEGDLTKAIFDLNSKVQVASFDFTFNNQHYIGSKKLKADLITKVNTTSLAFIFQKNDITLNKLPFSFKGKFEFLKDGYNMDFNIKTEDAGLYEILEAIPPAYDPWYKKIEAKGKADVSLVLKGKYDVATNTKPDLAIGVKIRNGFLDYEKAPDAMKHIHLDFDARMPQLNLDSLHVNIDSVYFIVDNSYLGGSAHVVGVKEPFIKARIKADLNLEKLQKAIGIKGLTLRGNYALDAEAEGKYEKKIVRYATGKIRKQIHRDTILASIPAFRFTSSMTNGYIKYGTLPKAIDHISFLLNASCPDGNHKHTEVDLQNFNADVLDNYIKGFLTVKLGDNYFVNADFKTRIRLDDIPDFYPLDSSISLNGNLYTEVQAQGILDLANKVYPLMNANINLQDGEVKTKYYPHPVEDIQIMAKVTSSSNSPKDIAVTLMPVSFELEGQPFSIKADLKDLTNVNYNISSVGTLDVGKIYKVFAVKGYGLTGLVSANLSAKGLQSDATSGHFERLLNSGTLQVKNLSVTTEMYPKPFNIQNGIFHFEQDKMVFDSFQATYGSSDFMLDGYLSNVINYALKDTAVLRGDFDLKSNHLSIDEFMAFSSPAPIPASPANTNATPSTTSTPSATGVVVIPKNLAISFTADVKNATYQGVNIDSITSDVIVDGGNLKMINSGFYIAGARAAMDATYHCISPTLALFDYHINAQNFDIKRAYDEVGMFRTMASSAKGVEGIVSLDYQLAGKLDANMHPIMPSIKGAGVLRLEKVQLKGFKLMEEVGKATDKEDLKHPDLSEVDIKSKIENNIMSIEKTEMKAGSFRPQFEGQVSLDGQLYLSGKVGLPPRGWISIPFNVTGNATAPVVKLKKGNEADTLHEVEDK